MENNGPSVSRVSRGPFCLRAALHVLYSWDKRHTKKRCLKFGHIFYWHTESDCTPASEAHQNGKRFCFWCSPLIQDRKLILNANVSTKTKTTLYAAFLTAKFMLFKMMTLHHKNQEPCEQSVLKYKNLSTQNIRLFMCLVWFRFMFLLITVHSYKLELTKKKEGIFCQE